MKSKNFKLIAIKAFLAIAVASITLSTHSQTHQEKLDQLTAEIKTLREQQAEIRRDQLNYRVEKEILKEVYSVSNATLKESYSSTILGVQLALSLALGIITIVGFIGVRSISEMKKEYVADLDRLRTLKREFDVEFDAFKRRQAESVEKVVQIEEINRNQEARLKVLELQDRAKAAMESKDHVSALELASIGLELSPKHQRLSSIKAACLARLGQFEEAVVAQVHYISLTESPNIGARTNLADFYLLARRASDYQKHLDSDEALREHILKKGLLSNYLEALQHFVNEDREGMKSAIEKFLSVDEKDEKISRIDSWGYDEVLRFLANSPKSSLRTVMVYVVGYMKGSQNKSSLSKVLATL